MTRWATKAVRSYFFGNGRGGKAGKNRGNFSKPCELDCRVKQARTAQAWCKKALWKARRTGSLPRKLKAMLETPPLILHPGHSRLISRVALQRILHVELSFRKWRFPRFSALPVSIAFQRWGHGSVMSNGALVPSLLQVRPVDNCRSGPSLTRKNQRRSCCARPGRCRRSGCWGRK